MKIYRLIDKYGWNETRTIKDAKRTAVSIAKNYGVTVRIERYNSDTKENEYLGTVHQPFIDDNGRLHPAKFNRVNGKTENLGF